jgi:predicted NUDIX family NTP pyrophosphohydrolase
VEITERDFPAAFAHYTPRSEAEIPRCEKREMDKVSAGLLMYRKRKGELEVLLVHPGGPFWKNKYDGAWFVPKGEIDPGEDPLEAAHREFQEETGLFPEGQFLSLGSVKHKGGKTVTAWAFAGDCDTASIKSNTFEMEWPPKSGKRVQFPEIDRAEFFTVETAREKMHALEFEFLGRLENALREKETE